MNRFDTLMTIVCEYFGVSSDDVKSKKQTKTLKLARPVIINVAKSTFMKFDKDEDLATLINRKRTSVLYHKKNHDFNLRYKDYRTAFKETKKLFKQTEKENEELVSE